MPWLFLLLVGGGLGGLAVWAQFVPSSKAAVAASDEQRQQAATALEAEAERRVAAEARATRAEADRNRLEAALSKERSEASAATTAAVAAELRASQSRDLARTAIRGTHEGPTLVCDRRGGVLLVLMADTLGMSQDEVSHGLQLLVHQETETFPHIAWSDVYDGWQVASMAHVRPLVCALPREYGPTLFVHTVAHAQHCSSSCRSAERWSKTPCKCACGGIHHGAGDADDLPGWRRQGWRMIGDEWQEHRFLLEPDWISG